MRGVQERNLIASIDIGTSKIVAMIGEVVNGEAHIVGFGSHPSKGLKRGVVVNIEATVHAIEKAVKDAELMAGYPIRSAYAGIAGSHIRSLNSHGIVAIRDREVTHADVDRVVDAARAVAIPADQKILHILPQEFVVDNQEEILEPVGMAGVRLEAKVHIITGAVSAAQNIIKCVRRCGLEVNDVVLEPLASSYAVLTEDEKDLGVGLIDIGGGTTDFAIFTGNAVQHSVVIPIAGNQVTNDIAVALRTPAKHAEAIKMAHSCAMVELASSEEIFEIPAVGRQSIRKISRQTLAEVCEPRYEELFRLIKAEIDHSGFRESMPAGIVLTGGGSKIVGAAELAEKVFQLPVRIGVPEHVTGLIDIVRNPCYATGVGLLLYGHEQQQQDGAALPLLAAKRSNSFKGLFERMRSWFKVF